MSGVLQLRPMGEVAAKVRGVGRGGAAIALRIPKQNVTLDHSKVIPAMCDKHFSEILQDCRAGKYIFSLYSEINVFFETFLRVFFTNPAKSKACVTFGGNI